MEKIIVTTFLLFNLYACKPTMNDIIGKYHAKHGQGVEYIQLFRDQSYIHRFKDELGQDSEQKGKWKLERKNFQHRLVFYNWIYFSDPISSENSFIGDKGIANCYFDVEKGTIEFWDAYEYNFYKSNVQNSQ